MVRKLAISLALLVLACLLLTACSASGGAPGTPASSGALSGAQEAKTSKPDNEKAVAAFNRLLPVFQSPRCANCHGSIDVFEKDLNKNDHMGGVMVFRPEHNTWKECQECHTSALELRARLEKSGKVPADSRVLEASVAQWQQPLDSTIRWGGKSPAKICQAMKSTFATPSRLVDHLKTDVLVTLGFEGKRGQKDLLAEPPPMTQEKFVQAVIDWTKAMGAEEEWPESVSAGCPADEPTPTPIPTPTKAPAQAVKYVLVKATVDCKLIESGFNCAKGTDTATLTKAGSPTARSYQAAAGKITTAIVGASRGDYSETVTWNPLPPELVPGQEYSVTLHTTYTKATAGEYSQSKASFCCPRNQGPLMKLLKDPTGGQTYFTVGPDTDFAYVLRLDPTVAADLAKAGRLPKSMTFAVEVPPGQFSGVVVRYEYQLVS